MSMPAEEAPIYITDMKTGEVVFTRTICDLPKIFQEYENVDRKVIDSDGNDRQDAVRFTVKGIIDGIQLSTHKINLYTSDSLSHAEVEKKKVAGRSSEKLGAVKESSEVFRLDD